MWPATYLNASGRSCLRFCLVLCLALGHAAVALGEPADAVAMVLADTSDGRSHLGSGFFIAADGRLLTCYSVIAGASKIRVTSMWCLLSSDHAV